MNLETENQRVLQKLDEQGKYIGDMRVSLSRVETMLSERHRDIDEIRKEQEELRQKGRNDQRELRQKIEELQRRQWMMGGAVLVIAVVIESLVLWFTRTPM